MQAASLTKYLGTAQQWAIDAIRAIFDELEDARQNGSSPADIEEIGELLASWLESEIVRMTLPSSGSTPNPGPQKKRFTSGGKTAVRIRHRGVPLQLTTG